MRHDQLVKLVNCSIELCVRRELWVRHLFIYLYQLRHTHCFTVHVYLLHMYM